MYTAIRLEHGNGATIFLIAKGKYPQAERLFQRAVQIWEQTGNTSHPYLAGCLSGLATLYYIQGKYTEASSLFQRALRIFEPVRRFNHPYLAY